MTQKQAKQDIDDVVEHKVRRLVAKKVIRDVHLQAEEMQEQDSRQRRLRNLLLPVVIVLCGIMLMLLLWPDVMRWLSGIIE